MATISEWSFNEISFYVVLIQFIMIGLLSCLDWCSALPLVPSSHIECSPALHYGRSKVGQGCYGNSPILFLYSPHTLGPVGEFDYSRKRNSHINAIKRSF